MYHEMPDVRKCNLCTYAANISKLAFNSVLDLLTLFQRHVYELMLHLYLQNQRPERIH